MEMFDTLDDMFGLCAADVEALIGEEATADTRSKRKARGHAENYGASPATLHKLGLVTKDGVANLKTLKRVLSSKSTGPVLRTDENVVMCTKDFYSLWTGTSESTRKDLTRKHSNPEFKPFQYYWDVAASAKCANIKTIRAKVPIAKTLMTYDGWKHFGRQVMQGQRHCYHSGGENYYFSFEQTVPMVTTVPRLKIVAAINAEHKPLDKDSLEQYPEWVRAIYFLSVPCQTFLQRDAF